MPARSNAMSELTRFWLEARYSCVVKESLPVPVRYGLSDIDLLALRPDSTSFELPSGVAIGPRVIVETKDEHDFDPSGKSYGKNLIADMEKMGDKRFIPANISGVCFVMLRQQHYEVAKNLFGCDDFDRLFVVHALDKKVRQELTPKMQKKRIHWLTVHEMLKDLELWYRQHQRPSGLRNTLVGDLFHLLFGYCKASIVKENMSKVTGNPR